MRLGIFFCLFISSVLSIPLAAEETATNPSVALNGYGSWNYGKTHNENLFLNASETVDTATRRRTVYGLQTEYTSDRFTVRAEHMNEKVEQDIDNSGSYVETSYYLTPHWQIAGEVGRLRAEFFGIHPTGQAAHLTRHDELTLGLNYWFDSNFVLKVNFARTDGNLYAHPDGNTLPGIVAAGKLRPRTDILLFGGQFTF